MQIRVPLLITTQPEAGTKHEVHHCRPLFRAHPYTSDRRWARAVAKLGDQIRMLLQGASQDGDTQRLMSWHIDRELNMQTLKLRLDLRDAMAHVKFPFVTFAAFDHRIAWCPLLDDLWFDLTEEESLETRAQSVLEKYFRKLRADDQSIRPESWSLRGKAWLSELVFPIAERLPAEASKHSLLMALFGQAVTDGAAQLQRVGRCLDWSDSESLGNAFQRETLVDELDRLLQSESRRPILLLGPPGAGKTAILHACVRRRIERRRGRARSRGLVWQISPARLISGMSYLGQWESRLLSILKHARKQDHVLYIDDYLAMFQAGITRDSRHSAADVLADQLDRAPLRLITEMTPEAWSIMQEKSRGMADRFQVIPVPPLDADDTLPVMITMMQKLEARMRCTFQSDVLPTVLDLYDRGVRDQSLPGKAVSALERLAVRHAERTISRMEAIIEYSERSGIQRSLIDTYQPLSRHRVEEGLRKKLFGQDDAITALADVILLARARMADRTRPLATMLLLGPTGTGKTQCAKVVAESMFEGSDGLVRFDMNEMVDFGAASRLVGTFDEPDGLLTAAVRRRPHCVLLFDEIEKAHPDVLDILLQVLGEGRLTDARGRTVDFTSALIIMTSNLGAREALGSLGFDGSAPIRQQIYQRAAKEFFRPEFYNRIDRVLAFDQLPRDIVHRIASGQIEHALTRDGLVRRRCLVQIVPEVLDRIVDVGFDAQLGARAIRRAIEERLVQPIANRLAAMDVHAPTIVRIRMIGEEVAVDVQTLIQEVVDESTAAANYDQELSDPEFLQTVSAYLRHHTIATKPTSFSVGPAGLDPATVRALTLKESYYRCKELHTQFSELVKARQASKLPAGKTTVPRPSITRPHNLSRPYSDHHFLRAVCAADDLESFFRERLVLPAEGEVQLIRQELLTALRSFHVQLHSTCDAAIILTQWTGFMHDADVSRQNSEGGISWPSLNEPLPTILPGSVGLLWAEPEQKESQPFGYGVAQCLQQCFDVTCEPIEPRLLSDSLRNWLYERGLSAWMVHGSGAEICAATMAGTHLYFNEHGQLREAGAVVVVPLTQPSDGAEDLASRIQIALNERSQSELGSNETAAPFPPVRWIRYAAGLGWTSTVGM